MNRFRSSVFSVSLWFLGGMTKVCGCAKSCGWDNKGTGKLHLHFRSWRPRSAALEGVMKGVEAVKTSGSAGTWRGRLHGWWLLQKGRKPECFTSVREGWHQRKHCIYIAMHLEEKNFWLPFVCLGPLLAAQLLWRSSDCCPSHTPWQSIWWEVDYLLQGLGSAVLFYSCTPLLKLPSISLTAGYKEPSWCVCVS